MSAEVLRRAAALMRERAEAARAGRWFSEGDEVRANWALVRQVATCHGSIDVGNAANAEHIASWHPAVALTVANLLSDLAIDYEDGAIDGTTHDSALNLARAYLGDTR